MQDRTDPTTSLRTRLYGTTAIAVCTAALYALSPGDAEAAGFALKEQSATALGNAFAGATAGAEDVSYMFFNPAGLTRHDGQQAAVVLSVISPIAKAKAGSGTNPIGGSTGTNLSGDAAETAYVPTAYGMWSLSSDLKLGLGINAPFGLSTKYDADWVGRYHGIESALTTVNINPVIAYRINDMLSVGAGLQAQYFDVTLSSAFFAAPLPDIIAENSADDWGFGFNAGVLFELSEATRIGVAYRSQVKHDVKGELTSSNPAVLPNSGATADFTSPDSASLGIHHSINDQWAVMGEVLWTSWSDFKEIRILFDNPALPVSESLTVENWDDSWFYALGATWTPNDKWTIRGGAAFDETPVPDETRTPRLPGNDRTWLSLGVQYQARSNFSLSAGYTHIFINDASVNLRQSDPGNALRGDLTLDYEGSIDILTVQGTFRF